jgi:hypothetical protein
MLALFLTAGLAACSSTPMTDMIPTAAGGLPSNAPQRSASQPEYPAVNDMPQRHNAMTDEEVNRTRAELNTLRTRQEEMAGNAPPPAAAPAAATPSADAAKKAKKPKDAKQPAELTAAKDQTK